MAAVANVSSSVFIGTKFAVTNQSTKVTNEQVIVMVQACAKQLADDFDPAWNLGPSMVTFYANVSEVPPKSFHVAMLDNSDQADALGYHSETSIGAVYAKVFVIPTLEGGTVLGTNGVSVVLSHEILEARADACINRWVDGPTVETWQSVALEVCDPCESSDYAIAVGTDLVSVSNFVFPSWFDLGGSAPFDKLGTCSAAFTLASGGYAIVRNQRDDQHDIYAQVIGKSQREVLKAHPLSRKSRRLSK